jgi:hypothetical protein
MSSHVPSGLSRYVSMRGDATKDAARDAAEEAKKLAESARVAARKAVGEDAEDDGDPTDAHQEEYTVHDDEDD